MSPGPGGPGGVGANALMYWEMRQAAVSNNLANASTPGFKAERVFARLLQDASVDVDSGTDFSAGSVNATGRPLDVALIGEGFLVVESAGGERWLRGGSLTLDSEGVLRDLEGRPVQGRHGEVVLPPGEVEIGPSGQVLVDGELQDELRLERPRSGSEPPMREGANVWIPTRAVEQIDEGGVRVQQGHLEDSNVDTVGALVEMIEIQRAYSAVQRSMVTEDDIMHTIASEIGRVG